jgi:hypothetical protein
VALRKQSVSSLTSSKTLQCWRDGFHADNYCITRIDIEIEARLCHRKTLGGLQDLNTLEASVPFLVLVLKNIGLDWGRCNKAVHKNDASHLRRGQTASEVWIVTDEHTEYGCAFGRGNI